jgi:NAD(P)-dependent dehydrogenase (short-subunit alcohol dehydrogenase family)
MTAPLVFITGASGGMGQALAAHYAALGWRLALVARRSDALQHWLDERPIGLDRARIYRAEMADVDAVVEAAQRCLAELGIPDVVIAAAGISVGMDTAERADLEVLRDTLAVNVIGLAATFHAFVAPMRGAGKGSLVGVASVAAVRGLPGHGAYCASKSAVVAYCESLRVELAGSGVRVVTLLPGYIDTPMTRGNHYRMPFLMSAPAFASSAARHIARGTRRTVIPWPMTWLAWVLGWLPGWAYDRMLTRRGRKPRRSAGALPGDLPVSK